MPMLTYTCDACNTSLRFFYREVSFSDHRTEPECRCGGTMKRAWKPASSQVKEVVDNGLMARRVELTKK
jgi:hypothetical protein